MNSLTGQKKGAFIKSLKKALIQQGLDADKVLAAVSHVTTAPQPIRLKRPVIDRICAVLAKPGDKCVLSRGRGGVQVITMEGYRSKVLTAANARQHKGGGPKAEEKPAKKPAKKLHWTQKLSRRQKMALSRKMSRAKSAKAQERRSVRAAIKKSRIAGRAHAPHANGAVATSAGTT